MSTSGLPLATLERYLREHGLHDAAGLRVTPLAGGQSNPTYRIDSGARQLVLRMQPPGPLLAGAHAIDREHRVMKALQHSPVPVPRLHAFCSDATLLGTPFYLMEFLQGRVLEDAALSGLRPAERGAIYEEMNRVIVALHGVDVVALGLSDYGRAGHYCARQIARWSKQCRASSLPLNRAMEELMVWLPQHLPPADETTLVHGDYRIDNLVFHASEPRVIGVLDWELSTLGDPLADLAYHGIAWHVPPALWRGIGGLDLAPLGIPNEQDQLAAYAHASGRDPGEHWHFYLAYNLFRMAAILHGIAQRAADGTAIAADAEATGRKAGPLAELGWQIAQRG